MGRSEQLRDEVLTSEVQDLLAFDCRLAKLDLQAEVRGGVAHVVGTVPSNVERQLARTIVSRLDGIHAVWDTVRVQGNEPDRIIDIGSGDTKQISSAIGIDRYRPPNVDVVTDLEVGLPVRTDSVDQVFAVHVLEHVHELLSLMNDIHRVLRPTGVLHALVPHWRHPNAVIDPTHVRFFTAKTFSYFCMRRPGVSSFRPLAITETDDTIYADLQPVNADEAAPSEHELARFFPGSS